MRVCIVCMLLYNVHIFHCYATSEIYVRELASSYCSSHFPSHTQFFFASLYLSLTLILSVCNCYRWNKFKKFLFGGKQSDFHGIQYIAKEEACFSTVQSDSNKIYSYIDSFIFAVTVAIAFFRYFAITLLYSIWTIYNCVVSDAKLYRVMSHIRIYIHIHIRIHIHTYQMCQMS